MAQEAIYVNARTRMSTARHGKNRAIPGPPWVASKATFGSVTEPAPSTGK